MEMTVAQLRELLECQHEDTVVRIVHQYNWPLVETLKGVVTQKSLDKLEDEGDEDEEFEDTDSPVKPCDNGVFSDDEIGVLYLVANGHPREGSPYGSKAAWEACTSYC